MTINGGSSLRVTSVGDNDKSKQMFWVNVNFGTKWVTSKNQQNVAFYNVSNPERAGQLLANFALVGSSKSLWGAYKL